MGKIAAKTVGCESGEVIVHVALTDLKIVEKGMLFLDQRAYMGGDFLVATM